MKFFSLNWFKSKKQQELESLKVEEAKLNIKLLKNQLEEEQHINELFNELKVEETAPVKPYSMLKMVNDTITIVLNGGEIISKNGCTTEDYQKIKEAKTEIDIFIVLQVNTNKLIEKEKIEKEYQETKKTVNGIVNHLSKFSDFELRDESVYMKGINRSMPKLLVNKFIEIVTSLDDFMTQDEKEEKLKTHIEYESLKKFWLKCCLNPNAQSAEDLYTFLTHHQFKIDRHGNFYAYRRVVNQHKQHDGLVEFVSNTYTKIKAVWKKNPANYTIIKTAEGEYKFIENSKVDSRSEEDIEIQCSYCNGCGIESQYSPEIDDYEDVDCYHCNGMGYTTKKVATEIVGNLHDLYVNAPTLEENRYTSAHTGKEDYRVGNIISMPRNSGDDNNNVNCSKGFHAASEKYDYSGFGDTPILLIINPMDVLAVPLNEVGKLRTCRWYFAAVLSNEDGYILNDASFDVTDLGDIFEEKCLENMQEHVQQSFAEEVQRHTFTLAHISNTEVTNIVNQLEQMRNKLASRVVNI